jgi:hypothetical protein
VANELLLAVRRRLPGGLFRGVFLPAVLAARQEGQAVTTLYRTIQRYTSAHQMSSTRWHVEVMYCGPDREQALIAYYRHVVGDKYTGYGNPATETYIEQIEVGDVDLVEDPPPLRAAITGE